jgi:hypothetical protein
LSHIYFNHNRSLIEIDLVSIDVKNKYTSNITPSIPGHVVELLSNPIKSEAIMKNQQGVLKVLLILSRLIKTAFHFDLMLGTRL